ncbi:sigma-70 family RNA polymerase sigma factor [Nocardioides panacisoli]|uniref:Sigma-70 family RNA polymerase sigma factor n=1 Tax=Nocardioides panacisoli TaxID=627624 RepID=A0ABP7HQT0_9ACTN
MADDAAHAQDEQLLDGVRAGDDAAYETLYREHLDDARRLGRILVGAEHADELVAESFAKVLAALRNGAGPTSNFRSYLHVTIRNGYRDGLRATSEAPVSDQPWLLDDTEPGPEAMVEGLDETVAVDALASLPESWQQVLWHVEVEGRKPAEVARLLDLRPGAVSSLAHRAREGLKRAYLDRHAGPEPARPACQWTHARMGQHARGDLGARASAKFDDHVADCPACQDSFLAVEAANRRLAAYVLPIVLLGAATGSKGLLVLLGTGGAAAAAGGAAAGAASGGTTSGGAAAGSAAAAGGGVTGPAGIAAAAAVAIGLAAVGAFVVTHHHAGEESRSAAGDHGAVAPGPKDQHHRDRTPARHGPTARPPAPLPAAPPVVATAPTPAPPPSGNPSSAPPSSPHSDAPSTIHPTDPPHVSPTPADPGGPTEHTDLASVRATQVGSSVNWRVAADVDLLGGPARTIEVRFAFHGLVTVGTPHPGAGWSCRSLLLGPFSVRCTFDYAGTPPPPVTVSARTNPLARHLSGTATLRSAGETIGTRPFG